MTDFADLALVDLAAARLWIALRTIDAVNRFWPTWDIADPQVTPELVREPNPDAALISAMRTGARIGVFGLHDGRHDPEQLPAQVWPYAVMAPDEFAGNVGRIGAWRGVTVVAQDLRAAFPARLVATGRAAMRAKLELVALAKDAEAGVIPVPIGAEWKAAAPDRYGINDFCAFKTWRDVAKDYPALSDPKGKPKRRKVA